MKVSIEFSDLADFEAWIRWRSMRGELDAVHSAAREFLKNGCPAAEADALRDRLLRRAMCVIGEALYA